MILQALVKYYEDLLEQGTATDLPHFGFSTVAVSTIVQINCNGELIGIMPAVAENPKQKRPEIVPFQMKRSGTNASPYFLCDNAQYVFGIEKDGHSAKTCRCFSNFKQFHIKLLRDLKCEESLALLRFLEKWNPEQAFENEHIQKSLSFCFNGMHVFRVADTSTYLHKKAEIIEVWKKHYLNSLPAETGTCLVTGETTQIARVHNSVKGIKADALSPNGWTLVSFDKDSTAYSSYGKKQGFNAPVGEYAAFAYTSALNHLLADRSNVQHIGDTTVVCWADGGEPQYRDLALACLFNTPPAEDETFSETDLYAAVKRLAEGLPCQELHISPEKAFYILGLAPNAARLSVRFFWQSSFGALMKNVNDHHVRTQIVGNKYAYIPIWALLRATSNSNSKDKAASPVMAGAVTRAIISGTRYPASLLENTMLRIRAEREITANRAAIIKAYYLKNQDEKCPKEVLTVGLNENSTNIPYTIGRLFAIYEAVQEQANPGINATIKDKYFNSVAATPAHILPLLNGLYQHHVKKLSQGAQIYYEKQVSNLLNILGEELPLRLSLPEQGAFQLGYYHQKQKRFEKKENK